MKSQDGLVWLEDQLALALKRKMEHRLNIHQIMQKLLNAIGYYDKTLRTVNSKIEDAATELEVDAHAFFFHGHPPNHPLHRSTKSIEKR